MVKQSTSRRLIYTDLGNVEFDAAWNLQHNLFDDRLSNKIDDTLLLLEHPHTYTFGKSADKNNLLLSEEELSKKKIALFDIDRGGDITYHGPGQIVGYPIISLKEWFQDTHKYLRALEEVIIKTLSEFGIESNRLEQHTGVWINDKKICAIGIKVTRWITMHGFAFNVNTDMDLFNGIIPCGIEDKGVTSLQEILGKKVNIDLVKKKLVNNFKNIFSYHKIEIKNIAI